MSVFSATLNQIGILALFIVAGFVLSRLKFVPDNAQTVLSKLENTLLIPAMVLGTFMGNFTVGKLTVAWKLLLGSALLGVVAIGLALLCVRFCSKDRYMRNIYTYGLSFSNFGFMGNAVVSALFPDVFLEYLIFTMPLWTFIYLWGVPVLLLGDSDKKTTWKERLKNFANPMFISMILGMIIGLFDIPVPGFIGSAVETAGNCMPPVAMLLTGMTIAQFDLREILKIKSVYLVTALRLLAFPLLFLGFIAVVPLERTFATSALCALAMPLGLNTIIIPGALGKDTKVASGMVLVSHMASCLTIPVIFMIFSIV